MAIEYKSSNTKAELLEIATTNGVKVDDSMTKTQIISELDAYNATEGAETSEGVNTPKTETQPAEGAQDATAETENEQRKETMSSSDNSFDVEEYDMFVYVGPSLPGGRLKENAVFRGTFEDVLKYLSDVLEKYPQAEKLIVPTNKLAVFSAKVKTPGNIAHKYYNDIVSTMRNHKEV